MRLAARGRPTEVKKHERNQQHGGAPDLWKRGEKRRKTGETNERENENRIKIVAERNPHFSFGCLEIRQSDLMALGGSVSSGLGK